MSELEITKALSNLIPELGGQMARAAGFLAAHPDDVVVHSMREVARHAGVAPVTLVRIAQRLGLGGYAELRRSYVDAVLKRSNGGSPAVTRNVESARSIVESAKGRKGLLSFAEAFFTSEHEVLRRAHAALTEQNLSLATDLLVSAPKIAVFGKRTSFPPAFTLAYALHKARSGVTLINDVAGAWEGCIEDLGPGDLFVGFTFTPFARTTDTLARRVADLGGTVMVISDSASAPLRELAGDLFFLTPTLSRAFPESAAGASAIANLLLSLAIVKLGGRAQDRISENEKFLIESGEFITGARSRRRNVAAVSRKARVKQSGRNGVSRK